MVIFQAVIIGIIVVAILILLDLATRLFSFLNKELRMTFDWEKLLLFYKKGVAPYFGIWLIYSLINLGIVWIGNQYILISIPGFAEGIMAGIIYAAFAVIVAKLGKSIIDNLKDMGLAPPSNQE